jgi:uncharacterized membrane protein YhaH (DUF805 family)
MDYKRLLFSFEGRINRAKYWLAALIILCWMMFVLLLLAAIGAVFGIPTGPLSINIVGISASIQLTDDDPASKASLFPQIVTIPLTLVFAWTYAAVAIKRLHDRNKRGWWMVPFIVASGLYGQFGDWLGDSWAAAFLGFAVFILFLWGLVEMSYLRGTRGPNRFGPDPLAPVAPIDTRPRWDQQSELEFVPHSAGPSAGPHVMRGHD